MSSSQIAVDAMLPGVVGPLWVHLQRIWERRKSNRALFRKLYLCAPHFSQRDGD